MQGVKNNQARLKRDHFMIIGCSTVGRDLVIERVRERFSLFVDDLEILAPTEKINRPRRRKANAKTPKPKAVERALFFNYVAVEFDRIEGVWSRILTVPGVWFVLMVDERPMLAPRQNLGGFNAGRGLESAQNQPVAFLSGPFAGMTGTLISGTSVEVEWESQTVIIDAKPEILTKM